MPWKRKWFRSWNAPRDKDGKYYRYGPGQSGTRLISVIAECGRINADVTLDIRWTPKPQKKRIQETGDICECQFDSNQFVPIVDLVDEVAHENLEVDG